MDWKNKKVDQFVVVNKILGQGQFGTVYRGHYRDDPTKQVAVKTIPMHTIQTSDQVQNCIKREILILTKIDNQNIVKLISVNKSASNIYMFLEYCQDGDLSSYLNTKPEKRLGEVEAVIFFKHVINGFKALQKDKIIHRDIKPSNILLHKGIAKIADFGFARIIENEFNEMVLSRVGSPIYMAPQILDGSHFTSKCDIWSLGVMFYELLYGVTPWIAYQQCELLEKIKTQPLSFPEVPVRSQKVKNLLKKMLVVDEVDRIEWQELFNDEIIAIDEAQILTNVESIQKEKDRLMRSISLNQMYMKSNLIMGYLQDPNSIEEESPKSLNLSQTCDSFQDLNMNKFYEEESQVNEIVQQVNLHCKYERNLAFFYNYVIQNLFQQINLIPISTELCFQLIFCISKNQLIKMQQLFREITEITKDSPNYQVYIKSQEFKQMYKHLQKDIDQANKFFVEILRKCLSLQNQAKQLLLNEQKKEFYQTYLKILDNDKSYNAQFEEVYYGTIKIVLDKVKEDTLDQLKLKYLLLICFNPQKVFLNENYDFGSFYDKLEYISMQDLQKAINRFGQ